MRRDRVHQIGRAVAWTAGASGGWECRRYPTADAAKAAAETLRAHIAAGGWTGSATMREVASDAARALANRRQLRSVQCAECGKTFTARDKRARYCSNRCRQAAKYRRGKDRR